MSLFPIFGTRPNDAGRITHLLDRAFGKTQGGVLYRGANRWAFLGAGTSGQVLKSNGANADPSWGSSLGEFLHYQNSKSSGTAGDAYTSGAWRTVILNTEVQDTGNNGSLASNAVTLDAGTYEFEGLMAMRNFSANHSARLRLRNTDDNTTVAQGVQSQGVYSATDGSGSAPILSVRGRFTISAAKVFELQIYPTGNLTAMAAMTTGDSEIYADLIFVKGA